MERLRYANRDLFYTPESRAGVVALATAWYASCLIAAYIGMQLDKAMYPYHGNIWHLQQAFVSYFKVWSISLPFLGLLLLMALRKYPGSVPVTTWNTAHPWRSVLTAGIAVFFLLLAEIVAQSGIHTQHIEELIPLVLFCPLVLWIRAAITDRLE